LQRLVKEISRKTSIRALLFTGSSCRVNLLLYPIDHTKRWSATDGLTYGDPYTDIEIAITKQVISLFRAGNLRLKEQGFGDLLQECLIHWFLQRSKFNPILITCRYFFTFIKLALMLYRKGGYRAGGGRYGIWINGQEMIIELATSVFMMLI
jgi:hypothetical protein